MSGCMGERVKDLVTSWGGRLWSTLEMISCVILTQWPERFWEYCSIPVILYCLRNVRLKKQVCAAKNVFCIGCSLIRKWRIQIYAGMFCSAWPLEHFILCDSDQAHTSNPECQNNTLKSPVWNLIWQNTIYFNDRVETEVYLFNQVR